jgi:hypothetical protein
MRKYTWIWCDEINIEQFMWGRKKLQWAGNKFRGFGGGAIAMTTPACELVSHLPRT